MLLITRADGESLQIGDVTVSVLDVGDDEVLLRIDCPEGATVEPGGPAWQQFGRLDRIGEWTSPS